MKLALIRRQFSATGGAELYAQRLLAALAQRGHEVHLFAEDWPQRPAGVQWHPVPAGGRRAEKPVRFAQAVAAALAREPWDCVFSLERTLRQDVYRAGDGVHRVWLERRRQFAPWWKKPFLGRSAFHRNLLALEAQTLNAANTRHVIVNSEMVKQEILAHFPFPADRIHLIRNGVDVDRFQRGQRAETRARFGLDPDDFVILFVGSGWERKGLDYLLAALAAAAQPRVKLLVVGKGRRPARVPDRVVYAGNFGDVENAYAAADLFAFLPVYEPSANVVVEALAAGLPVVTTLQNGASELIEEGVTGSVIASPAETQAAADALVFWMNKPGRIAGPGAAALSLDRNVSETLILLERAAHEKAA